MTILADSMAVGGTPYLAETLASAFAIASRAVICDIECEGIRIGPAHDRTWDVRPMLDEREHSPEFVDMAREAVAFALAMRLAVVDDASHPHIVRIVAPLDQ